MLPAEALERAADLIETVGHCKDGYEIMDDNGVIIGYCALGALNAAVTSFTHLTGTIGVRNYDLEAIFAAQAALREALINTQGARYIADWNDATERTASDVVDMLKHTAKDLRNTAA